MSDAFHRSSLMLQNDSSRGAKYIAAAAVVLTTAWLIWFFQGSLPLFASSEHARIEVDREANVVATAVDGEVVAVHVQMGQEVRAGDLLLELDSSRERFRAGEELAAAASQRATLHRLRAQIALE